MSGNLPLWQFGILMGVGLVSSLVSTTSSVLVIRLSLRQVDKIYHSTLLALSVCDVGFSISNILQLFLTPYVEGVENVWARGNATSCASVALIYTFCALVGPVYNCFLSCYFYLTIVKNWKDRTIVRWIMRPVHVFAVALVGVPILGWVREEIVFHELAMICVPARGLFFAVFPGLLVSMAALGSMVAALATNRFVKSRLNRSRRYIFHSSLRAVSDRTIREANVQSILYCIAFWNSFIWILLITIISYTVDRENIRSRMFPARLIMYIFVPLQGLLNFSIYVRPHTLRWKRSAPDRSWSWAIWQAAYSGKSPPPPEPQISPEAMANTAQDFTSSVDPELTREFDCGEPNTMRTGSAKAEDT